MSYHMILQRFYWDSSFLYNEMTQMNEASKNFLQDY